MSDVVGGAPEPEVGALAAGRPGVVLACGLATLDVVQTVDHVPGPDEKVVATDLLVGAGGPAANAAVTARLLGAPARLVTRIGGGALAAAVTGDLAARGVEVLDLAEESATPPVSTVLVTRSSGERAVVSVNATRARSAAAGEAASAAEGAGGTTSARAAGTAPPDAGMACGTTSARAAGTAPPDAGMACGTTSAQAAGTAPSDAGMAGAPGSPEATLSASDVWADVRVVLVDGHHLDLALSCAAEARRRGVVVVLDGGSWKPGLERLLALVDVAVLSADFAVPGAGAGHGVGASGAPGAGEAVGLLTAVRSLGPRVVAQSRGAEPLEILTADGVRALDVPRVRVVDTLGAGDVLHGALVAWLAAGELAVTGRDDEVADVAGSDAADRVGRGHAIPGGRRLAGLTEPELADRCEAGLRWAIRVASASVGAPGAHGWAEEPNRIHLNDDRGERS